MKFTSIFATLAACALASASPLAVKRDSSSSSTSSTPSSSGQSNSEASDLLIAEIALAALYIVEGFLTEGLQTYQQVQWDDANYDNSTYGYVQQIGDNTQYQISAVSDWVGSSALSSCSQYNYEYSDLNTFLEELRFLEFVAEIIFFEAALDVSDPQLRAIIADATIITAQQLSFVAGVILDEYPWTGPSFNNALGWSEIYDLIYPYLNTCPSTYSSTFTSTIDSALSISPPATYPYYSSDDCVTFTFTTTATVTEPLFAVFFNGASQYYVALGSDYTAQIPDGIYGDFFVAVTELSAGTVDYTQFITVVKTLTINPEAYYTQSSA